MKNLSLRTKMLASLKANDLEMTGTNLAVSARTISELVSQRKVYEDSAYGTNHK